MEKNIAMYECLGYYDNEFKKMVNILLRHKFQLFRVLVCIYKKRINNFLKADYKYKEEAKGHFKETYQKDHSGEVMKLISCLGLMDYFQEHRVENFIGFLKNLEQRVILNKIEELENLPPQIKQHEDFQNYNIYSFGLFERLIPSIVGLLIGIVSTCIRSIIIACAVDATSALAIAAGVSWIPVLGWVIGAIATAGTVGWIGYNHMNGQNEIKHINYLFEAPEGYRIIHSKVRIRSQLNGIFTENNSEETAYTFNYTAEFSAPTSAPQSAYIKIRIIIHYCEVSYQEFIDENRRRLEAEKKTLNE